ncbi:hypothetical protein F5B20DRAFT_588116 [Whalleya microplaca]|nr:hypothetical protein F5B20DRAFT_588116 [Whalleya microplaca]
MAGTIPIKTALQSSIIGLTIVFSILALTAVVLRVWAKRIAHRALGWSDFLIFGACGFVLGLFAIVLAMIYYGGEGLRGTEYYDKYFMNRADLVVVSLWLISCCLCKLSILCLYYQIFKTTSVMILAPAVGIVSVICVLGYIITNLTLIRPLARYFSAMVSDEEMDKLTKLSIFGDAYNLVTDVVVFLLPLPAMAQLQMNRRRKFSLIAVFAIGFGSCLINLARTVIMYTTDTDYLIGHFLDGVEPTVGIIAACIPTLHPLLGRSKYSQTGTIQRPSAQQRLVDNDPYLEVGSGSHADESSLASLHVHRLEDRTPWPSSGLRDGAASSC